MSRILINTGKAISLQTIAMHLSKVLYACGHNVHIRTSFPEIRRLSDKYDAVLYIYPFGLVYANYYLFAYKELKRYFNDHMCFYTLVDGFPKRYSTPQFLYSDIEFIANSHYSKKKLELFGAKVIDVIHHGYDPQEIERARSRLETFNKIMSERFKDKIKFVYVGDINIRKGVQELISAVKILRQKYNNFVVLFYTKQDILPYIRNVGNCVYVGQFGSRSHFEIYLLYMCSDYTVLPSRCESFGLPLLESNACKRPVVATKLEPFLEYADAENNIFVDPIGIKYVDTQDGILYEIHYINSKDLAEAMETAIDIYINYKSKYEDMCEKVYEKVKDMTIYNLYSRFLEYLKLQCE